jgi:hypothetical protein
MMNQVPKEIVHELKRLIERRIVKVEPEIGFYGWICIAKSISCEKGQSYYKIGKTNRLEAYLANLKNEPLISKDTPPLVLKVWGGASYIIKVIRRIFKDKRRNTSTDEKGWFALNDQDIGWLSTFKIVETESIESEVYDIFGKSDPLLTRRLKKEGLW